MPIAILGWGSLIWNPGNLHIDKSIGENGWFNDGPKLPIEFARISSDGRLTLVISKDAKPVTTYYALSLYQNGEEAILNLAVREGCGKNKVGYYRKDDKSLFPTDFKFKSQLEEWLTEKNEIDTVIWTNLKQNFEEQLDKKISTESVVNYLSYLPADKQAKAEEYIRRTPSQIQTEFRSQIEEKLGWTLIANK